METGIVIRAGTTILVGSLRLGIRCVVGSG